MGDTTSEPLRTTPLDALHRELGARMVPFAGYAMPVQYRGILHEHAQAREKAALFDVSHMGQAEVRHPEGFAAAARAFEALVPGDLLALKDGQIRYTLFTNAAGGILDDLMVTRDGDHLFVVVNAACKEQDFAHMAANLAGCKVTQLPDRALLALQGPEAAAALARLAPEAAAMPFMTARALSVGGIAVWASRSGYTGEDGYEISVAANEAETLARLLLAQPEVDAAGLGARDSLRLEAGLCLYGSDIDATTTPIEAGLKWVIGKRRREEGGFPGAETILEQLAEGPARLRVGLRLDGRQPARAHSEILDANGGRIGEITSGGFGPTVEAAIAMGYVDAAHAATGTAVACSVRGRALAAQVVPMPFAPHRYFKG
ncbi:Aminomethyltransferase, mitochondrial [uncultured Alphaproteobacteria bacterium]|uniref:aminomethyltransferase n=1 Tax=uncultured Alphaproteobacteria bacterium TaxID=91750 RepID=A0A212JN83_9PROT|nr:Aminomethyltransferase, mitochondrial [uncultured Alphaproteobacteria bacterium]